MSLARTAPCVEALLALVCGYAPKERDERYFGMYVCHGDDSGKGGPILVIGGLTAKINDWLAFTVEWQAALDARPKLEYFKFAEAFGRYGQFHKRLFTIQRRNARVARFIKIINRHCLRADATISHAKVHKELLGGKISATVDQPFVAAYTGLIACTAIKLTQQGVTSKVDFIFDEMDETTLLEVRRAHNLAHHNPKHRSIADRLGQPPITRDDRTVIALQAADLWAGLVRQGFDDHRASRITVARKWLSLIKIRHFVSQLDEAELTAIGTGALQMMDTLNLQYESGKQRSKRLAPQRKLLRGT